MKKMSMLMASFFLNMNLLAQPLESLDSQANGDLIGNGGDALVKYDAQGQIVDVIAFDYYEAENFYGLIPDLPEATPYEIALEIVNRIAQIDPLRHEKYVQWIKDFERETRFLNNVNMTDVADSDHSFLPVNYKIEQMILQKQPIFTNAPRYLINNNFWEHLSNGEKAMMIIHEIIYREGIMRGHKNSIASRYFNAMLSSNSVPKDELEYVKFLNEIGFLDQKYCMSFYVNSSLNKVCIDSIHYKTEGDLMHGVAFIPQLLPAYDEYYYDPFLRNDYIRWTLKSFYLRISFNLKNARIITGTLSQGSDLAISLVELGRPETKIQVKYFEKNTRVISENKIFRKID